MLTRRGASALQAIVLFSFITWLSGNPIFTVGSLTLILIFVIENLQLHVAAGTIRRLKIERHLTDSRLEVGMTTHVTLKLKNPMRRSTGYLIVDDHVPEAFAIRSGSSRIMLRLDGHAEATIHYSMEAVQIGDYRIGDTRVVLTDALGFFTLAAILPVRSRLEVYPRLRLIELLRATEATQVLRSTSIGQKAISKSGLGSDFRGIREYYSGDDFKRIAWKAVAKSSRRSLMIKEFEDDRSLNLVLALHAKRSLLDGLTGRRKLDYAIEAIVAIAYAASLEGDRVHLVFEDCYRALAIPGQNRQQQLLRTIGSTYNILPTRTQDLQSLVECTLHNIRQRSLIVLITDLENQDPMEFDTLVQLLRSHVVQVVAMKTISLFPKPNLGDPHIEMAYRALTLHEQRAVEELAHGCWRLEVPLRLCDPNEIFRVLSQIYLGAKKTRMILI